MKIGLIGCGKIGRALLREIRENAYGDVVFVLDRSAEEADVKELAPGARLLRQPEEDCWREAELIIECAAPPVLTESIEPILKNSDLLLFSITAFSDPGFEARAMALCREYGRRVYIPHGAVLGLDGILDGRACWESVSIETIKSPASLGRTDTERAVLYEGPTREACKLFPRNVNVHAAIALAGLGFDRTMSRIVADPAVSTNTHVIAVKGEGIDVHFRVSSFTEGGVTGKYTPFSACGSLRRVLDRSQWLQIV